MPALEFPITTERLSLRPYRESDVERTEAIYSRPDVARYLLHEPLDDETARAKVAERIPKSDLDGASGALALVIERDRLVIGDVHLWFTDREHRTAEIGWVLDPAFGGRGYGVEAVRCILALAFEHYRVRRVAAQMDARNTASAKLAERAGMQREAHLREHWWSKGEWTDTVIFGMLPGDRREP